jgi:hypothetical protein
MTESGLSVEVELPFSWKNADLNPVQQQADQLLMRVVNLLDMHEPEQDKTSERIEAKLDLMLHWLGWHLFSVANTQPVMQLSLSHNTIEWNIEEGEIAAGRVVLSLAIHPAVPSPLHLLANVLDCQGTRVRAELIFPDEPLEEAWNQWLFRRHRRAIQEARLKTDTA